MTLERMEPTANDFGNAASVVPDPDRAAALKRWLGRNGKTGLDDAALREAAALSTPVTVDGKPAFDDDAPRGLAEFIAEMPF